MKTLDPEVTLFARMAAFGIVVGAVYWFLTYEVAGAVLLTAFGLASTLAGVAVFIGGWAARRRPARDGVEPSSTATEPLPRPGWAPLGIAVGLGGVALGGAFGPWLAIAGALVAVRSAKSWLDSAVEETDEAWGGDLPKHPDEDPARDP